MSSSLRKEHYILQEFMASPNIVQCFGAYISIQRDQKKVFNLFLEYASGGSLLDLIKYYGGKIPEPDVKCYCFRGTPIYMSPESVIGEVASALDVWSLGCIIIKMISGKLPWVFDNLKDLRDKLLRGDVPNISENMSIIGKNFITKCFTLDPNQRWTARKLLTHPYPKAEHNLFMVERGFPEYNSSIHCSTKFQVFQCPKGFSFDNNILSTKMRDFKEELRVQLMKSGLC
ncbi:hypothetical protein DITRI_Ditri06bG0101800 [Diplodiscus trichospermus]